MIETTQSIIAADGASNLPRFLKPLAEDAQAAHFGTYDYTASCSITADYQDMLHPACDFARSMMQIAFGGTGVWLSDGATNIMPVAPHRGENLTTQQIDENNRQSFTALGNFITNIADIRSQMLFIKAGIFTPHNCRRDMRPFIHFFSKD